MSSQRSSEPVAGGEGVAAPPQEPPLSAFDPPMKNPGHALG